MKVVVLGAGVVGIASAWYLAHAGHEVIVVERRDGAGLETSFANGGQISVSHAEPWANPSVPAKLLKLLGRQDSPLLFKLRADPRQWRWALRFLRECSAARTRRNIVALLGLGLYSRARLQALRKETGIHYDERTQGILHFYTDAREFEQAVRAAAVMREFGCDRVVVDADEAVRIEPALAHARAGLVGGTYTATDESGDAHLFTTRLASMAAEAGVRFAYGTTVTGLEFSGSAFSQVIISRTPGASAAGLPPGSHWDHAPNAPRFIRKTIPADACVVCLGSFTPLLLAPRGVDLSIYPAKGYSVTMPVMDDALAHQVSLTDDAFKLVYSRLGNRLRIAGTAELNGYDASVDTALGRARCGMIMQRVQSLFPGAGDTARATFWAGLRPSTPSNVPCIGPVGATGLYVNSGHGTLGWTHACGSGSAIADLVGGRRPDLDFPFLRRS